MGMSPRELAKNASAWRLNDWPRATAASGINLWFG